MNWQRKIKRLSYLESLDKLLALCNMHNLRLYKHSDNYLDGSMICVLSPLTMEIGMTYAALSNEKDNKTKTRWYLSFAQYMVFTNL